MPTSLSNPPNPGQNMHCTGAKGERGDMACGHHTTTPEAVHSLYRVFPGDYKSEQFGTVQVIRKHSPNTGTVL